MKTFFVCASANINNHVDEEYDDILEVENQPTTETIDSWAGRISNIIRRLWHSDKDDTKGVVVTLDAATPYNLVLQNLKIAMKADEGIEIELPYVTERTTNDREAIETIERLENRQGDNHAEVC